MTLCVNLHTSRGDVHGQCVRLQGWRLVQGRCWVWVHGAFCEKTYVSELYMFKCVSQGTILLLELLLQLPQDVERVCLAGSKDPGSLNAPPSRIEKSCLLLSILGSTSKEHSLLV